MVDHVLERVAEFKWRNISEVFFLSNLSEKSADEGSLEYVTIYLLLIHIHTFKSGSPISVNWIVP